jgi:hypothetical protein
MLVRHRSRKESGYEHTRKGRPEVGTRILYEKWLFQPEVAIEEQKSTRRRGGVEFQIGYPKHPVL